MYIMRLDDASEYMDRDKWLHMEKLLIEYKIKPIFGIIPKNGDPKLLEYGKVPEFWNWAKEKANDGWTPAMHGYNHVYETECGGLNPVNKRSEFAGVSLEQQRKKIGGGYKILKDHGIEPEIFFAPSHTFDENTLKALENETPIRVISDTIANDVYYEKSFYFIPQQAGQVRQLPFETVTFCYHPNTMNDEDFKKLEAFLKDNQMRFKTFSKNILKHRKRNLKDKILKFFYFIRR